MEEKLLETLSLSELWKAIPAMSIAQLIFIIISLIIMLSVILAIVFKKPIMKYMHKKMSLENILTQDFWSEEGINIRKTPSKLSLLKTDAKEYQKLFLSLIDSLRNDKVSGKQFVINMEETVYMSTYAKNMFKDLADNSISLNIVRLVYVIPAPNKQKNAMDKYYLELLEMCKKHNKPGSWAVKYSSNKKKFYEV